MRVDMNEGLGQKEQNTERISKWASTQPEFHNGDHEKWFDECIIKNSQKCEIFRSSKKKLISRNSAERIKWELCVKWDDFTKF